MSGPFDDVQRNVLVGTRWQAAQHVVLRFHGGSPLHFLNALLPQLTGAGQKRPEVQVSLGFTLRGLRHASVPPQVLACFALKSPAFCAGAALRAASELGLSGTSAPEHWDPAFASRSLDAALSIQVRDECKLGAEVSRLIDRALSCGLRCEVLPQCAQLPRPEGVAELPDVSGPPAQWVHFGYRDGLSRIGIEGWTEDHAPKACKRTSRHKAGEFVLGHEQDSGANPWLAGPGPMVWPREIRSFFHNGSFGVLQQIEQDVDAFEGWVQKQAREVGPCASDDERRAKQAARTRFIKGKLCGRFPDGLPLGDPTQKDPGADFDYRHDAEGVGCPFGSHARRMNPRLPPDDDGEPQPDPEDQLAHFSRRRPLLRRGMPYQTDAGRDAPVARGLLGQFFCASIEDQYEHLLGQWADRVPLGSPDRGGARDPFVGGHEPGDGPFEIPQPGGARSVCLSGLTPFTRTRGVAYLFYPSLETMKGIARGSLWGLVDQEDKDPDA